jgi:alkylation response protein AidB-like acyl-CoA dehydrogenase
MRIAYTDEQVALRDELRQYYDRLLTDEIREELHREMGCGPTTRAMVKQMAADGWLGIGWPKEYGGQGRPQFEQFIFFDEFGTEEQKAELLPRILAGEISFCIGYSEADAGTDLASLTTRAVRDGDEYVINGRKMWTSLASDADYCWLAARTDPDVAKHKGISIFIVDMRSPGIEINPLSLLSSHDINETLWNDVRVPARNLVGGEGNGWQLIVNQLNHERVTLCSPGLLDQTYSEVLEWSRSTKLLDGRRVIDQEWVQLNLARVHAGLEFLRLINWKMASAEELDVADASATKAFGTEFYLEAFRLLMEVIGPQSYLERDSVASVLRGRLELNYRLLILTFGGGTNEIQRDLIAMFGLGLPRALRH